MSCVHRSTVFLYKLCTVVQYICTQIHIYEVLCLCPVNISCLFRQCATSIYRNVCQLVSSDKEKVVRTALYRLVVIFLIYGMF